MEQYLGQLHLQFVEGRAAVAQKLHSLARKGLVIAALELGDSLIGVVGGQSRGRASASLGDGAQLPKVIGGPAKKKVKSKSAEEKCVDSGVLWSGRRVEADSPDSQKDHVHTTSRGRRPRAKCHPQGHEGYQEHLRCVGEEIRNCRLV